MKQIIDRILKEEEDSRRRIEAARLEAENIVLLAKKEAKKNLEESLEKSLKHVHEKKEEFHNAVLMDKDRVLRETKEANAALRKKREGIIPELARKVFQRVIGINA